MKKTIALLTVLLLVFSFTVTAFAFPNPWDSDSGKKEWEESNKFKPQSFTAEKCSITDIKLDANATPDAGYTKAGEVKISTPYNGLAGNSKVATATVYTAWSKEFLYILSVVKDSTPAYGDTAWSTDSVEIYIDYDMGSDGKKTMYNHYPSTEGPYAAQIVIPRTKDTSEMTPYYSSGTAAFKTRISQISAKVADKAKDGYVVETMIPLKGGDGKYIPKSNVIGFTVCVNDDSSGGLGRTDQACMTDKIQAYAWEYTHLMDTLTLNGADGITWSTRKVSTDAINKQIRDWDGKTVPVSVEPTPDPVSEVTPLPSEAPVISEDPASTDASSTVSRVSSKPAEKPAKNDSKASDVPAGTVDETDDSSSGGLSTGALVGIIVGAAVLLAAAAAVIIIVIKKNKTSAPKQ